MATSLQDTQELTQRILFQMVVGFLHRHVAWFQCPAELLLRIQHERSTCSIIITHRTAVHVLL